MPRAAEDRDDDRGQAPTTVMTGTTETNERGENPATAGDDTITETMTETRATSDEHD